MVLCKACPAYLELKNAGIEQLPRTTQTTTQSTTQTTAQKILAIIKANPYAVMHGDEKEAERIREANCAPWVSFLGSQVRYDGETRIRKESIERHIRALGRETAKAVREIGAASADRVLISTFISAQEREALRRALAKKRPLIAVFPAGIPGAGELDPPLGRGDPRWLGRAAIAISAG